jgi:hypothetical protein
MNRADPRAAWLKSAAIQHLRFRAGKIGFDAALDELIEAAMTEHFQAGEITPTLDAAIDELFDPFLEFVGAAPSPCPICGDPPCRHDEAWCEAVREGQARRAAEAAQPKPERPTPQTTIEAIMYAVRTQGLAALNQADTLERLRRCDERAIAEINSRIANLLQTRRAAA